MKLKKWIQETKGLLESTHHQLWNNQEMNPFILEDVILSSGRSQICSLVLDGDLVQEIHKGIIVTKVKSLKREWGRGREKYSVALPWSLLYEWNLLKKMLKEYEREEPNERQKRK